jgi:RNA polymerase sigma-70 factor, ECF subfamily
MSSNVLPIRIRGEISEDRWSDEAIALACRCGDPRAVAELFDRYQVPVTRFLARLVEQTDLEDLVQSVFLQIARGRSPYDGRSSAKTWVFAIASNIARQHYRKSKVRRRALWALASVNNVPSDNRLTGQVEARRSFSSVCDAFDSMSENARLAFVMCEVDGGSAREASEILGTTETAVWKRVSDVRRALARAAEGLPLREPAQARASSGVEHDPNFHSSRAATATAFLFHS